MSHILGRSQTFDIILWVISCDKDVVLPEQRVMQF